MKQIRFCEHCQITKDNTMIPIMFFSKKYNETIVKNFFAGFIYGIQESYWENTDKCPFCKNIVSCVNITEDDVRILFMVSNGNRQLLEAMIDLHDKDIIEYELKMSQFRSQAKSDECCDKPKPKICCPKCGSTQIQIVPRKFSILTGFATNKTDRVCVSCKYKW